ncbi:MAG: arsenite methyltransferase [Kiritimatiellia bacterium]
MPSPKKDQVRQHVRERYAGIAKSGGSCGCGSGCCQPDALLNPDASAQLGYSKEELAAVPEGANLGLGCGNPQAIAALRPGETVVDLGCGGGFDCFLAARRVGKTGQVIGVDMTPEMVHKARANAAKGKIKNVDFRLGEIEHLPVADATADVILSNCVINLSPDKPQVFADAFRVLKPGGRLAISDVVAVAPIPARVKKNLQAHSGCIAGSATVSKTERMLKKAGFSKIRIDVKEQSKEFIKDWFPGSGAEKYVRSATIEAEKTGAKA